MKTFALSSSHIYAEHALVGERRLCTTGYFSMVALDEHNHPIPVPDLLLTNEEAQDEWALGEEIRRGIDARRLVRRRSESAAQR